MTNPIIHIANDEKFINSANWQFESVFPNQNLFYIYFLDKSKPLKHVSTKENVVKFSLEEDLKSFISNLKPNQIIVFHSLSDYFLPIIEQLPSFVTCIWLCFGYEVYNDKNFFKEEQLLDTITKQRFGAEIIPLSNQIKKQIKFVLSVFKKENSITYFEIKKKAIKRMDYIACSFDEEYYAIKKLIKQEKKIFPFWYYPIEKIINIDDVIISDREDIIIGNSGFSSGNHLDVFNKIKDFNFNNRKIIVPLSYGNQNYIEEIINSGTVFFKDDFIPLTTFLPLEEYNKSIKKCSHAIFNSFRQQAVGNTIALLWFGSKVFLSKKNPFYGYLKRIGVHIYNVEEDLTAQNLNEKLTITQIEVNRQKLLQNLNTQLLLDNIRKEINTIDKETI